MSAKQIYKMEKITKDVDLTWSQLKGENDFVITLLLDKHAQSRDTVALTKSRHLEMVF
jgi:hypothetical protein